MRIQAMDPVVGLGAGRWLRAILILAIAGAIGSIAGTARAGVHVVDNHPPALDTPGGRLLRIDPQKLAITLVADGLPAGNGPVGVGPAAVDFSAPLFVTPTGDIYLATAGRGIVQLKQTR